MKNSNLFYGYFDDVYYVPDRNRISFDSVINSQQQIKDEFKEEYKNFFEVKKDKIYLDGKLIFVSKRKTIQNIWSDFIKNFWYLDKNEHFRKTIIEKYKEMYVICDAE